MGAPRPDLSLKLQCISCGVPKPAASAVASASFPLCFSRPQLTLLRHGVATHKAGLWGHIHGTRPPFRVSSPQWEHVVSISVAVAHFRFVLWKFRLGFGYKKNETRSVVTA